MLFSSRRAFAPSALACLLLAFSLAGCGGGSSITTQPPAMTLTLATSTVHVQQDGTASPTVLLTVANAPGAVAVSVSGLPSGITASYDAPSATLTVSGGNSVSAGTYAATVTATSGTQSASQPLSVVNDVVVVVSSTVDTSLGVHGKLQQFMSTSFQIGSWTTDYFGTGTQATQREATLNQLGPQHIRVQVTTGAIPMVADAGAASDWNFNQIDLITQPVLASADQSPELQIAVAPSWMCLNNGQLDIANHLDDFAAFMANLVRYYNKSGFDYGGMHFQSPSSTPIVWWGIFNEYNLNGLSAADYVKLYNTVVPAMLAVDPTIKLSALEFSDFGLGSGGSGDPMQFLPAFVSGATAQADIISTHFYGTCNQRDTDTTLFNSVAQFAANVQYFYQELQTNPTYANTPVWVTENNVNADYNNGSGMSTCNPGQTFVTDTRGSSAFFAAWRPYVFSQLGKAGNQALYHWAYSGDQQYGEVDGSGTPYLSYWVDKTLASLYPYTAGVAGPDILSVNASDTTSVETLATRASNGTITILIADHAIANTTDNNGAGAPRTVVLNLVSATSANAWILDAATSTTAGPTATPLTPQNGQLRVTLPGYGVAFVVVTP